MRLRRAGFRLAAVTPLKKYLCHRYEYSFSPSQLCYLVGCLRRTADVAGDVVEIGCAYGHTTVFLAKHLEATGDPRDVVCIDTFEGFTTGDAAFEVDIRGKAAAGYEQRYADASLTRFQKTLVNNDIHRVQTIKADIKAYDMGAISAISFCLIDVDLYLPVRAAISKVRGLMSPGGIVVVDDCKEHPLWDGAFQAYSEFAGESGLPPEVVEDQFGVIRC